MQAPINLNQLNEAQLRQVAERMLAQLGERDARLIAQDAELAARDEIIRRYSIREEQLTHEIARLKRHRFGKSSEGINRQQYNLLEELVDEDTAAIEQELERLAESRPQPEPKTRTPKRRPLPPQLPRTEFHHEPEHTTCNCGCALTRIGEDISEKLDYEPGSFSVERHIRGKWACRQCETAELPRSTLADWVGRCGVELTPLVERLRSTLPEHPVLHADETPMPMLSPGKKRTHQAYIWAYATTRYASVQDVVYDFQPSRSGKASRDFLANWRGHLVCDDYTGYKAGSATGMTEVGCWAHARRKFHEMMEQNQSPIAEKALTYIVGMLYDVERQANDLPPDERQRLRDTEARPVITHLREWLTGQRSQLTNGTRTAKAIDYTLKRWSALVRYLDDGNLPIDNNWVENQIRPWAIGRNNWLFAGSLRSGQRGANVMTLIQSAKINGLDPQAYLKDVLARLPSARQSDLDDLLPHNWTPGIKV